MTRSRIYYRSSSFKMALLFTVLLSAAVLSLAFFMYESGREGLVRDTEGALDLEIDNILLIREIDSTKELESIIEERINPNKGIHYLLTDINGNRLGGDLSDLPDKVDRLAEGILIFEIEAISGKPDSWHRVAAKIHTFQDGTQLLVARDMGEFYERFTRLRMLSILSIGCMMLVILVSFLISLFVVSRINRMSDIALEIMETGDLSQRLNVDSRWDDLSHLARVLNEMLDRIESLVEGVKQVSNNIAHDLRTPLTRIRNRLEQIRSGDTEVNQIRQTIEEADQLLTTFNALLKISRMDAGQETSGFEKLDLKQIMEDVLDLYRPVIIDSAFRLIQSLEPVGPVMGDRNLIFQVLVNILDNAVNYAGGGELIVSLKEVHDASVQVEIEDSGPGIPSEEKGKVFDRFYRCDQSRSTHGSGLGLSMVASVMRLHKARIELYDASTGGLGVRLYFSRLGS